MKMLLKNKLFGSIFAVLLATLMVGCGGGGAGGDDDDDGGGGSTPTTLTLTISGQPVTVSQPATVQIKGPANTLVTLSTTVGTLSKSQVATSSNGTASVQLSISLNDSNDGVVTASIDSGTTAVTQSAAFTVGAVNLSLGKAGAPFTSGQLLIGVAPASLSPGGTTQITAVVWDNVANAAYTQPINVSFSSNCVSTDAATVSSPVQAVNGVASTTYKNISCQGSDVVIASIAVGGGATTASGTIGFTGLTANNISFVSANPNYINLAGIGVPVTTLTFRVKDSTGIAIPNQQVDFVLNTTVGGLSLTSASNQTDANGFVTTSINPGSIPTSVRVTATVHGSSPAISTQSSQLAVTTGLPAQGHMSIAVSTHAVEAMEYDGVSVDVTARLADRYGNPVPDGTTVNFVAEGGTISDPNNAPAGFCQTLDGACTMKWRSQAPRPGDHRVSIVGYALGEKDFDDADGDGYFSTGDTIINEQGEAFLDADESNVRNAGENYHDFNLNGSYSPVDGKYYGARCETNCGGNSMDVSTSNIIVLSSSVPILSSSVTSLTGGGTAMFQLWDQYGQPMPAGTKVDCSTSGDFETSGPDSYTMPDMIGVRAGASLAAITATTAASSPAYAPNAYNFACGVKPVDPKTTPGKLFVTITTPKNLKTIFTPVDLIF